MALIVSAASGNFNAGATWVGGVVPTVGDEARAATGHTITITANATCDEVSNEGTGIFTLSSGVTLTANVTNKSTTTTRNCLQFTAASPSTATIIGDCKGGNVQGAVGVALTSSGILNIVGNIVAGAFVAYGIQNNSSGTINITGNVFGGLNNQSVGAINSSNGTINITGNCFAGAGASSSPVAVLNNSTGAVNITGNCVGGGGNNLAFGANNASTGTMTIVGNCTGGGLAGAFGANNASTGTMTITGSIFASEFEGGVGSANRLGLNFLTGPFYTSTTWGVNPIRCASWRWATNLVNTTFIEVPTSNLAAKRNLVTPDNATNFPAASNVRSGTTYGISGELVGSCIVPNPASVAAGVGVDNTIGTLATPTAEQVATAVWNAATSSLTTSGSIGERLKNASTVSTTGEQLATALTAP